MSESRSVIQWVDHTEWVSFPSAHGIHALILVAPKILLAVFNGQYLQVHPQAPVSCCSTKVPGGHGSVPPSG